VLNSEKGLPYSGIPANADCLAWAVKCADVFSPHFLRRSNPQIKISTS
jgi:hypothetical protein